MLFGTEGATIIHFLLFHWNDGVDIMVRNSILNRLHFQGAQYIITFIVIHSGLDQLFIC